MDFVVEGLDKNSKVMSISLDLLNAFGFVELKLLLNKRDQIGIR